MNADTEHDDPKRLSEDASSELHDFTQGLIDDIPPDARIEALTARVVEASAGPASTPGSLWMGRVIPISGVLMVTLLLAGSAFWALDGIEPTPSIPQAPEPSVASNAPTDLPSAEVPTATELDERIVEQPGPETAQAEARLPPRPRRVRPSRPTSADTEEPPQGSRTEVQILNEARRALNGMPRRALTLTQEHHRLFPRGVFTEEREVIAIGALSALGRRQVAAARARRFFRTWPRSAHRAHIEDILRSR